MYKSFKSAVKTSLIKDIFNKPIHEGVGSGNPSSLSVDNRNEMPPMSSYSGGEAGGRGIDMRDIDQGQNTKAPARYPFSMDTLLDHLGEVDNLIHGIGDQLTTALKNPSVTPMQKLEIEKTINIVKSIRGNCVSINNKMHKIGA